MLQAQADTTGSMVMAELYDRDGLEFTADSVVDGEDYSSVHFMTGASPGALAKSVGCRVKGPSSHDLVLDTFSDHSVFVFGRKDIRDAVFAAIQ